KRDRFHTAFDLRRRVSREDTQRGASKKQSCSRPASSSLPRHSRSCLLTDAGSSHRDEPRKCPCSRRNPTNTGAPSPRRENPFPLFVSLALLDPCEWKRKAPHL